MKVRLKYLFNKKQIIKSQLFNFKQCYLRNNSYMPVKQVKRINKYIKKIEKELL